MTRSVIHYVTAAVIMTIYGGQVCPFLESLTIPQIGSSLVIVLAVLFAIQAWLARVRINKLAFKSHSKAVFIYQLIGFIVGGIILMVFNTIRYDFPLPQYSFFKTER